MHVSNVSIAIFVFNMALGLLFPIVLMLVVKRKYQLGVKPFFLGCLTMFLFALVLEQIVHAVVLGSPAGSVIQNNFWLMALYGGLMAGLFEETGRFVTMKFLLKKEQGNDHNAIMYGIGHGGIEMAFILVIGMVNQLLYAVMINTGQTEALLAPLDASSKEVLQQAFESLVNTPPYMLLLSPVERLAAITAQIAFSVLVWIAVTRAGKKFWYVLAILLHLLLDAVAVILNGLGISTWLIEGVIWIMALSFAFVAVKVWRANRMEESSTGSVEE